MPGSDDKLTDIPHIVARRDDDTPYRRGRAESAEARRQARAGKSATPREKTGGGGARAVAVLGLLLGLAASGAAGFLYLQNQKLEVALAQSNLRISDLEGRLSTTDDSVNQSSAAMQVKIKELASEVDKLWASAWRKNNGRLDGIDGTLKKLGTTVDGDHKKLATLSANQEKLRQQVDVNQGLAISVAAMKESVSGQQETVDRLGSTVNTLSNTQRAQEARLKDAEQWVKSNIEFRKQVTQRLTRLENPPEALPAQ